LSTIAGLASLVSYPALLAAGLPAPAATMTNTVALVFATVGGAAGSRPELAGQSGLVRRLALAAALGGAVGAGLLLVTPPGVFERIVPFLVAAGALVLLLQPRIRARAAASGPVPPAAVRAGTFLVGVYAGYFGAAAGVLMLALLLVGEPVTVHQGNALKTVFVGAANVVAGLGFALFGPVRWAAVVPLAAGALAGSWTGPAIARRLPTAVLRTAIGVAGLLLALALALDAY
jgi:uncharacterized membrane protein YfcA